MNREAELSSPSCLLVTFEKPNPDVQLRREPSKLLLLEQWVIGLRAHLVHKAVSAIPQGQWAVSGENEVDKGLRLLLTGQFCLGKYLLKCVLNDSIIQFSGKNTLSKCIMRLEKPFFSSVLFISSWLLTFPS